MKKIKIGIVVLVVLGIGLFVWVHRSETTPVVPKVSLMAPTWTNVPATETFAKDPVESFAAAVRRVALKGFPSAECTVETQTDKVSGRVTAYIGYPESDVPGKPAYTYAPLCNAKYAPTSVVRFFTYDPAHPDQFYFFEGDAATSQL